MIDQVSTPLKAGVVLANRYRILELLGRGGFGAVYKAWDENFNLPCAVKENLDTSPEAQRQFMHAARILRTLRHPNLPQVIDHFILPDQGQYLVMDFVEGVNLKELLLRRGHPLPESEVLPWVLQICEALSYLHAQQPPVIHRDIKPQNIIITPAGQVLLVDFGIAKTYDPDLPTTAGARAVTPGYSPPEQYGQGTTDARSDLYALGATLYTLLTGRVPPASVDIVSGTVNPPQPVNLVNVTVSSRVSAAILRAMQPNRTGRFASAAEFKTALGTPETAPSGALPPTLPAFPKRIGHSLNTLARRTLARPGSQWPSRLLLYGLAGASLVILLSVVAGGAAWLGSRPTRTPTFGRQGTSPLATGTDRLPGRLNSTPVPGLTTSPPAPLDSPTAPPKPVPASTTTPTPIWTASFTAPPAAAWTETPNPQPSLTPTTSPSATRTARPRPTSTVTRKPKPSKPGSYPGPTLAPP